MKPYVQLLEENDSAYSEALVWFRALAFLERTDHLYTDEDKRQLSRAWEKCSPIFLELERYFRSLSWRSFFGFGSKNSFVVKYAVAISYYNKLCELQRSFGIHEEFIRQYLDDTFRVNYSTLARAMYFPRFYALLLYPDIYFQEYKNDVDPRLLWLFSRPARYALWLHHRIEHDRMNIWYYIRYRIWLLLTWIARHGGRAIAHLRFTRRKGSLIDQDTLSSFSALLESGDILLTRQNWAATNLNIPGFWKHMSMYLGTGEFLKANYRGLIDQRDIEDHASYIIEAVGIGVRIIRLRDLADHADYLCALRPRFSREKKSSSMRNALELLGREYDYSFNFFSDKNFVCSTLVLKSYLPDTQVDEGIHIELTRIGLGITYPPNDLIKKYQKEHKNPDRELDFVAFIDASESREVSFLSDAPTLISTLKRPFFSFLLP